MLPMRQKTAQLWPQATWQEQWFPCAGHWNSCSVGTAWASLQFCGDAQDRDALGWKSFSSQVTSLMGRGMALDCTHQWPGSLKERTQIFYWVAFTNYRVYCWPSCHLCQGCVWPMCYLGQDKIQRWGGPEQNWQLHLPDWNLKSLATFSWFFFFFFKYTWMTHL